MNSNSKGGGKTERNPLDLVNRVYLDFEYKRLQLIYKRMLETNPFLILMQVEFDRALEAKLMNLSVYSKVLKKIERELAEVGGGSYYLLNDSVTRKIMAEEVNKMSPALAEPIRILLSRNLVQRERKTSPPVKQSSILTPKQTSILTPRQIAVQSGVNTNVKPTVTSGVKAVESKTVIFFSKKAKEQEEKSTEKK